MNPDRRAKITTRNDVARDIVAGFAAVTPTLAGVFRLIDNALADLPAALADLGQALDGHQNIAAANRHHARDPQRTLKLIQAA
jgi:hypothetical protein